MSTSGVEMLAEFLSTPEVGIASTSLDIGFEMLPEFLSPPDVGVASTSSVLRICSNGPGMPGPYTRRSSCRLPLQGGLKPPYVNAPFSTRLPRCRVHLPTSGVDGYSPSPSTPEVDTCLY